MQSSNAIHPSQSISRASIARQIGNTLLRKLWLPKAIYETLPFLYLALGLAALTSVIYAPEWTWMVPYTVLMGLVSLHFGVAILTLRYRYRYRQHRFPSDNGRPDTRNHGSN
jgi:hypothetical protein